MQASFNDQAAGAETRQRLFTYNGGFLTQRRLRRILTLAGYDLKLGLPREDDLVGVWGHSPTAHRGEEIAQKRGAALLRIEDAFLRSLHPGRAGEPPLGLTIDRSAMHFDPSVPSDLETLLSTHPLDDTALMDRARACIARLKDAHLSKYSAIDPSHPCPEPGYVLVIDQTLDDASVRASKAGRAEFLEMLVFAQQEHPGKRIVIKTHPETSAGYRAGHYHQGDSSDLITLNRAPVSPWALLDGAAAVYTVSSQLGFEAIFAGHKPRVFGQPFYAGWGLTQDERPLARRQRSLSRAQLFAAAMILYPIWYDPHSDALCEIETVLDTLEARARAWREDRRGWAASGMRLWKRRSLNGFFGQSRRIVFTGNQDTIKAQIEGGRGHMVWAAKTDAPRTATSVQLEDGFLRSRGLGAALVPPLSLVLDDLGIYYDPTRASRLEKHIQARAALRPDQSRRIQKLISDLRRARLSKYNLQDRTSLPDLPEGHKILVPGQVENDASILTGTKTVRTNLDLLRAARQANPSALLIYKPHPDVEAGLRPGKLAQHDLQELADVILHEADPIAAIDAVDEVWTMTSLLGFEALLRGTPVTCLGAPFYAGWGLTRDLGATPARRAPSVSLEALAYASLIDYPRYFDPVTQSPCSAEVAVLRLQEGTHLPKAPGLKLLSKLQGALASKAHLWR